MKKNFILLILIMITLLVSFGKNQNVLSQENLLAIHILDVGQGDCILIQTPNNKTILVDGGDEDSFGIINSYLRKLKIKDLDIVIASHFDSDHIGSLDNIVGKYNIGTLYSPEDNKDTPSSQNLRSICNSKNLNFKYLYKGDTLNIDENLNINVLSPSYIQEDSNKNSIVFKMDFYDKSFLFTGDCENDNELDIINNFELDDVDFLKVSHHGSKTSTTKNFLKETTPDLAVISCGYKNQYGHPHDSTLSNLKEESIEVFRTDLMGDLVFYSDGSTIFTKKNYLKE